MLDRQSHTNETPRRNARLLLPCLLPFALAATCVAGLAQAPKPAAAPAPSQPPAAEAGKQEKPKAAAPSRVRRVDGPAQESPATAKAAPSAKSASAEKSAAAAEETELTEKPATAEQAAPAEEKTTADEAKDAAKDTAKSAAGTAAPSVGDELERLRAEIEGARPEERGRLQRALVDRLVALGRRAEALSELRLMIHEDRFDPAFFYNTGNALARLGDANAAADAYRKAVSQRRGNYARALNNLGVVLTRQGRWDEAFDALTAALTQENFTYAEASYNLGRLYLLRGQTNLALREWSRTLRLQPDHAEAAAALARALAADGDEERAVRILESFTVRTARVGGTVPREIAYARRAIAEARDAGGAVKVAASSNVADPSNVAASNSAASPASFKTDAARPASAPRAASSARQFGLDRATYGVLQTARAAGERGRYEEAAKSYRGVLARSGGYFPPANLELSFALMNLNRTDEAVAALSPVAERDGARFPVAHYHLARLYERLGQLDAAARHFQRAAELYGDENPQMLVDLSRVRERSGDARGALDALEAYATAISRQGSVPYWVIERADGLRLKAKGAPAQASPTPKQ